MRNYLEEDAYEPDIDTGDYIHIDDLPDIDKAKDFLGGIVEAVYETGNMDLLEHCLEELCEILEVKMPAGKPRIKSI